MRIRFKIVITFSCLLFFSGTGQLESQILKDTATIDSIKKGINYVYNFEFTRAHEVFINIGNRYPGHPVTYLLNGLLTYWENYPLLPASSARNGFEEDLRTVIKLCDKSNMVGDEAENLLASLCARGFLLLYYTDNDLNFEVFPLAISSYPYMMQSFNFTSYYSDFLYFTGVYNYYTIVYPETYPIYKPLALLFKKGDRIKGLGELKIAADNSIFLKAESLFFLSEIFLSFEDNFQQATYFSKKLHDLYPDNPEYLGNYVKNLLLIKKYDEAEKLISLSDKYMGIPVFIAKKSILNGIIMEKKYHDYNQASELYTNGIKKISPFGYYGNEYAAYAYFGLSRISEADGDQYYKNVYLNMALKLANFKNITFD